ncbi:MAG TPA: hypothetical protein VGG98_05920 [Solirubrobacteraceae bacterium]
MGPTEVPSIAASVVMALDRQRTAEGVAEDVDELVSTYRLIGNRGPEDELATSPGVSPPSKTPPRYLALTARGRTLSELLRLDTLPEQDRRDMVAELFGTMEDLSPDDP